MPNTAVLSGGPPEEGSRHSDSVRGRDNLTANYKFFTHRTRNDLQRLLGINCVVYGCCWNGASDQHPAVAPGVSRPLAPFTSPPENVKE
jgi:hypothetical protein